MTFWSLVLRTLACNNKRSRRSSWIYTFIYHISVSFYITAILSTVCMVYSLYNNSLLKTTNTNNPSREMITSRVLSLPSSMWFDRHNSLGSSCSAGYTSSIHLQLPCVVLTWRVVDGGCDCGQRSLTRPLK